MKIRLGFISNSSSSSFVMIGWKLNNNLNDLKEVFPEYYKDVSEDISEREKYFCDKLYEDKYIIHDDGNLLYGIELIEIEDNVSNNEKNINLEDIKNEIDKLSKRMFKFYGQPKLITGTWNNK